MPAYLSRLLQRYHPEERAELDEYERITCLVELLQSKARLSRMHGGM
jgi:hypothetical protein